MAECVRRPNKEHIFFFVSDSFVQNNALREIVKYFSHPKVGAVAGHAYVTNANKNVLTKMQAVRYYVAFKAYKAAEALFGAVTCCSGCCSAYRKSAVMPFLEKWVKQRFLGVQCTYGDDRSLTNYTLYYGYDCIFAPEVIAHTIVPDTFKIFMRQQFRWKKSWARESLLAAAFMWRKNIIMSLSFYPFLPRSLLREPLSGIRSWQENFPRTTSSVCFSWLLFMVCITTFTHQTANGCTEWYSPLFILWCLSGSFHMPF